MRYIVVGSGYAGSICARYIAEELNEKVVLIEKRNHIAGNMYDFYNEHGILVHMYGPHISVMNNERAFNYLSRFTEWLPYEHRVDACIDGMEVPLPINLNSINMLFEKKKAEHITQKLLSIYGTNSNTPILALLNCNDKLIKKFGEFVYEKVFLHYTQKMWGLGPKEIDPSITARIPIRVSYDDRHFLHKFQVMPKHGYTKLFQNMLNHDNIEIRLDTKAVDVIEIDYSNNTIHFEGHNFEGKVIYTGALDEMAAYRFGELPYRSLKFKFETFMQDEIQKAPVLNWPDNRPATRRTEMKKLTQQKIMGVTSTITEYPGQFDKDSDEFNEPMYPINNNGCNAVYDKYKELFESIDNFYFLGRLADYKYYNMEATILCALDFVINL